MDFSEEQVMLTLAALTYRGFQDALSGTLHQEIVREALLDGLNKFDPVRDEWDLVWGPVTTRRVPIKIPAVSIFDWNSMYIVRHKRFQNKYAIAIRGTNPIELKDWLFGDLFVGRLVQWPYGDGSAAISASTALGLAALQAMRAGKDAGEQGSLSNLIIGKISGALHAITSSDVPTQSTEQHGRAGAVQIEQEISGAVQHWIASITDRNILQSSIQKLESATLVEFMQLRPKLQPEPAGDNDLLSFLKIQAANSNDAMDVTVTGHSKGGALAPVVALWLKEALTADRTECWDETRRAQVRCYAYAGPTPGNAAFADRVDATLGDDCHQVINTNDIVPHAFDVDDLAQIPALFDNRTAALAPVVEDVISKVRPLTYRHPAKGIKKFAGTLERSRLLPVEIVYQHLDAYLAELSLLSATMNAVTFFV